MSAEQNDDDILRTVRTRPDRVLRFEGTTEDSCRVVWFVAYRGKYGWVAQRRTGEWMDEPSDEDVRAALETYDSVAVVHRAELPEVVRL
jgi:hypothetical protein